ncbi:MAG TPA: amidohydrolase [Candidatus Sumerlaeota bacterium]|mgnify:CR=1 FL=1|nr:amidohydrolase [Candidatus Sumerlaeota bacterium]
MTARTFLLENARIHTLDPACPFGRSMLVLHGRVVAVTDEPRPVVTGYGSVEHVNCNNLVLLPAFTDAHLHLMDTSIQMGTVDVSSAGNEQEAARMLRNGVGEVPPGQWVQGSRWGHNLWDPPSLPSAASLDALFPENPVFLYSKCEHLLWANSLAMKIAGITAQTPDPPGGEIEHDPATGELTGIFKEDSAYLISNSPPPMTSEQKRRNLARAAAHLNRHGIVNVHASDTADTFALLQDMVWNDPIPLDILLYIPASCLDDIISARVRSGFGSERLRFGGIKFFVDGSLGGRTAWMNEPFCGEPGNIGIPMTNRAELLDRIMRASAAGLCAMTHAIGDHAVELIVDVYREAQKAHPFPADFPLMHRIEHFQLISEAIIAKLPGLRVAASFQPVHIFSDWSASDRFWGDRSRFAYAVRTAVDCGLPLVFGSDSPVEPVNVFWGLYAAVCRRDLNSKPEGGWYPGQAVSPLEALAAYTSQPCRIAGSGGSKGILAAGYNADFVLADGDPLMDDPEKWRSSRVIATALRGEFVHNEL